MIGRKTVIVLGDVYESEFSYSKTHGGHVVRRDKLYDFLFANEYEAWFANMAKTLTGARAVKEWLMRLHTGETLTSATPKWSWEQRERLGQEYLGYLAADILAMHEDDTQEYSKRARGPRIARLKSQLELDGYKWSERRLLFSEASAVDAAESSGVIQHLISVVSLAKSKATIHFLELSEQHFIEKRWSDSIANSRKFLESAMQEVAAAHSLRVLGATLKTDTYEKPVLVRDYLEREGLLETREKETVAKIYGLLSHTGGHPYMADNDQARLLRHLSLTVGQFVLLRYKGSINK